jgi:phenylpropionate dioxygenase-like ring-hydroxylating dioxygenase large terminal subunit
MWVNRGRLPLLLTGDRYRDPANHDREMDRLFLPGWHFVGSLDDLARDGDFITLDLFGRPLLIRRSAGRPRAFLNVCAHRHAKLTGDKSGRCERMRCQYHGWEYDDEGAVCKVPDARSFLPIARGGEALKRLRADTCGKLIFVSLAEEGPGLAEALGEETRSLIEEGFGPRFHSIAGWDIDHAANWKVPIENSLESYHVPVVHLDTFARMPDAEEEHHALGERSSSYEDWEDARSPYYRLLMRAARRSPRYSYRHHHSYPSLTLAFSDLMSYVQVVVPTSPTTSRSLVRVFLYEGERGRVASRLLSWIAGPALRRYVDKVLAADGALFADIQRGVTSPDKPGPGSIGAREERVHAFQGWVKATVGEP